MSIYEVHLASAARPGYRELAVELADYVTAMGFTHVELFPVAEHPYGGSWGYQVSSYFAPTARLGGPDDFRFLVDSCTGAASACWWTGCQRTSRATPGRSPGSTARPPMNTWTHSAPTTPDWGTLIFDYGRREVAGFLISNALYWLDEFHLDGLRVDAVASMLYLTIHAAPASGRPTSTADWRIWRQWRFCANSTHGPRRTPGVLTIAEESTSWPGVTRDIAASGLGILTKWNMGWMHDTLGFLQRDIADRAFHHHQITFSLMYAFNEQFKAAAIA